MSPLLEVRDLHVSYYSRAADVCHAVAGVSFDVNAGEVLGVLGESGSGKSTLATSLMRLLPANARIQRGQIRFQGQDLLRVSPRELRKIRGSRIGLIFQEPSLALHPTIRVGRQISEVLSAHETLDRRALDEKTAQVLAKVFSEDAHRIAGSYPHQLSGGQRQRVLTAQAIACNPPLLIADEPTASLDPSTQQEILDLFHTLHQQLRCAIILITHNPALLLNFADRVLVLYAGKVAEIGPTKEILSSPQHPYTRALLKCLPPPITDELAPRKTKLTVIPGDAPNLGHHAHGCRFEPRCPDRIAACATSEPAEVKLHPLHAISCFRYGG